MVGRVRILGILFAASLAGPGLFVLHQTQGAPRTIAKSSGPPSATLAANAIPPSFARRSVSAAPSSSQSPSRLVASSSAASVAPALARSMTAAIIHDPAPDASAPAVTFSPASALQSPFATVSIARSEFGINVFSYDQQLNDPSTIGALNSLDMGAQQFPNLNTWSWTLNEANPGTPEPVSLGRWGQILSATGSEGLYIFNYDENTNWTGGGTPAEAAAVTRYIVDNHLPVNAIVIGSEEYGAWDFAANLNPSQSATYYADQSVAIAQAIHGVDPSMLVGVSFDPGTEPYDVNWNQTVLRTTAPYINFVSVHDYPIASPLSDSGLLTALPNYISSEMQYVRSEISANVPAATASAIQIWVTEFNPYGEPGVQSTQPVYGAALVESAMLWRALGADRLFVWSYDGQAHAPSSGWPTDTSAGTSYGLFALAGDGQAPEIGMNAFYPSAQALASFMQAIGGGGTLSLWAGSGLIVGQVQSESGYTVFLINETANPASLTINGQSTTVAAASMDELHESGPIHALSMTGTPTFAAQTPPPAYQPLPDITSVPASFYAGQDVTVSGTNFGADEGTSYLTINEGSVSYGSPSDAYQIRILGWSNTSITFEAPDNYSGPALPPGTATLQVVVDKNVASNTVSTAVVGAPGSSTLQTGGPQIASVTSGPSNTLTISGSGFGPEPSLSPAPGGANDQGVLQIHDNNTNANYAFNGLEEDWYGVDVVSWTDTTIVVQFGPTPPAVGDSLTVRFYGYVNGTLSPIASAAATFGG